MCWHFVRRVYTLTWVRDVFLFDSRSFGFAQVGVTFACDLILHGGMHHCGAGTCFSTFLAQMTPHSQKRNMLMLSLSLTLSLSVSLSLSLSLPLYRSHTYNMCTQTASAHWMTVWMYLINEWVTLLLCYYNDFSLLCITSCNRVFCSATFTTVNSLRVHSFRPCRGLLVNLALENIIRWIFQITCYIVKFVPKNVFFFFFFFTSWQLITML